MHTIRKKYRIEMAHQLTHAVTACCHETIHGHSYVVEVFIRSRSLDENNMVVDFGALTTIRDEIMRYDHALVMSADHDPAYLRMLKKHNKKLIVLPDNPTAEMMAMKLLVDLRIRMASETRSRPIRIVKVRLHETDTGYAEAE